MTDRLRLQLLTAGLLYLLVIVTGIFSLVYVPSHIPTSGDPGKVAAGIIASEMLFRFGIAAFLIKQIAFLLLPLALHRLLRQTGRSAAALMVAFAWVSVPMALIALGHRVDALRLIVDPALVQGMTAAELAKTARFALDAYRGAMLPTSVFWGLWLLPLGLLVFRSGIVPKALALFLVLGGLGYVASAFGDILISGFSNLPATQYLLLPAAIGEIGTCFWLLFASLRR